MKSNPRDLQRLLEKVLSEPGDGCGPSRDELLELVRHEHSSRRHLRTASCVAAFVGVVAIAVAWPHGRQGGQTTTVLPLSSPGIVINHVDDEQLMALLKDTPVALMEWPNGERTVLVIDNPNP